MKPKAGALLWIGLVLLVAVAATVAVLRVGGRRGDSPAGTDAMTTLLVEDRGARVSGIVSSSKAVLAYLQSPGAQTLGKAMEVCGAVYEANRRDIFTGFLVAFCRREMGDSLQEEQLLARWRPEQREIYRYLFVEHRDALADGLFYLPAYVCRKHREAANAELLFPPGSTCPAFGTPLRSERYRSGAKELVIVVCPGCDAMLAARSDAFLGSRLLNVRKENPLGSLLLQLSYGELDPRRLDYLGEGGVTPSAFFDYVGLKRGQAIADIGCGIGFFVYPFAEKVGERGKIYAQEVDERALDLHRWCIARRKLRNVVPVRGFGAEIGVPPASLDAALLYHVYGAIVMEMDGEGKGRLETFLDRFFASIRSALRDGGTLIVGDRADPRFGFDARRIVTSLEKRGFDLGSDISEPSGKNLLLLFRRVARPESPKS